MSAPAGVLAHAGQARRLPGCTLTSSNASDREG